MSNCNLISIIFICLISLYDLWFIKFTTAQPTYLSRVCRRWIDTPSSTFQTNKNLLLRSLSSANNSIINNGFHNATVGRRPDIVYGSFQCTGDILWEDCQACVKLGTEEVKKIDGCKNSTLAIIWYDMCMFKYSAEDGVYITSLEDRSEFYISNDNNVADADQLRPVLVGLLTSIAESAVGNTVFTNFATGDTSYNNQKVNASVQCTADISSSDCTGCVSRAISELRGCCDGKQSARVLRLSCNIGYEIYPISQPTITDSPPRLSSPATPAPNGSRSSKLAIGIVVTSATAVLSAIAFWFFCFWRKKTKMKKFDCDNNEIQSTDSLQFNFSAISTATDNFSEANKLGEGGFGSVYKGTFPDRQEIAVKRLSKHSGQGDREFKNEVTLVAKLQHKNLVKLVGFSLAAEEKLLIYEFMPNASLDQFLFDPIKCTHLNWETRYKIIGGIAKGLVYLHEESRLKIIHRDLKASNILLDTDMNPKIADFGMARLFVLDQTQASTKRIVGTHGYMAPEYILYGKFSVKSDVFSFGVLLLEILSGQRNNCFHGSDIARDLLSYAWRLWKNGSATELLDPTLKDTCSRSEAMKCIHVALLCVQENVVERPTMPTVVQMLNNSLISHESPSPPAFFVSSTRHMEPRSTLNLDHNEEQGNATYEPITEAVTWSVNEASITELYPR